MANVPGSPFAEGPDAAFSAALNGDAPFVVWLGLPDVADTLEVSLETLDPVRCAVVRVGNPLSAPLTPQRVMLQLAPGGEGELEEAATDGADHLLRSLRVRAAGRASLLVVVERAETLTSAALDLLQLLPGVRGPGVPTVRVAFHGTSGFRTLLRDPRFRLIHDAVSPPPAPSLRSPPGRRRVVVGAASLAVVLLLAVMLLPPRGTSPGATSPATPASPFPPASATAVPVPTSLPAAPRSAALAPEVAAPTVTAQPNSSPQAAAPSPPQPRSASTEDVPAARARLFREFNAFVEDHGLAGRLSRSAREALFREYLARRYAPTTAVAPDPGASAPSTTTAATSIHSDPDPASSQRPEVVLFLRAGHPDAAARADDYATVLRGQWNDVVVRPATDGPAVPSVRYYRPEDRSSALDIALSLPSTTPDWQVVDLSGAADRPLRSTIEVWVP